MTALETLIRTASMDGAAHYRELAKEAQRELDRIISDMTYLKHYWACHPEYVPPAKRVPESPCTPTDSVDKP